MGTLMTDALAELREKLRYQPVNQRVRVLLGNTLVAETTEAVLVWEPRCVVPAYAVPASSIVTPMQESPYEPVDPSTVPPVIIPEMRGVVHLAPGSTVTLAVDGALDAVGYRFDDPDLADHVLLPWEPFTWQEELVTMVAHAQDPFSRIKVLPSDRHVVIRHRGTTLAESSRPALLLETGLPPRWYVPRDDIVSDLFETSSHRSVCAYKGTASYLSLRGDDRGRDLAWYYPDPRHDAEPVRDLVCFWSERTDLELDGRDVPRPSSLFDLLDESR
jgi:uncharacterized protein (DUF427 family)